MYYFIVGLIAFFISIFIQVKYDLYGDDWEAEDIITTLIVSCLAAICWPLTILFLLGFYFMKILLKG